MDILLEEENRITVTPQWSYPHLSFILQIIRFIINYMADNNILYQDKDVIIRDDRVIIKCYFFPFGQSKTVYFHEIERWSWGTTSGKASCGECRRRSGAIGCQAIATDGTIRILWPFTMEAASLPASPAPKSNGPIKRSAKPWPSTKRSRKDKKWEARAKASKNSSPTNDDHSLTHTIIFPRQTSRSLLIIPHSLSYPPLDTVIHPSCCEYNL